VFNSSLSLFRAAFGVVIVCHALLYFRHDLIGQLWIEPSFHFTYLGFGWVRPWPGVGMYLHVALLATCGLLLAAGVWSRIAALLAGLALSYLFLLEQALYLNHVYLLCLTCFLMACAPRLSLGLLRFQFGLVYVYAGLAKLNGDWLAGEPIRMWLEQRGQATPMETLLTSEAVVYLVAWGGLLFDLSIVPLLLWRRTRVAALILAAVFHLSIAWLFPLGVFPWFMLAATTLLLPRDWPRRVLRRFGTTQAGTVETRPIPSRSRRMRFVLIGTYAAIQLLLPLRHHLYPGDVAWTEEGHRYAWRMRVKDKVGAARFRVRLAGGTTEFTVDPATELRDWQVEAMVNRPDMILQYAYRLRDRMSHELGRSVEVRVDSLVSLNGRPYRRMIDPEVDLAVEPRTLASAGWIEGASSTSAIDR